MNIATKRPIPGNDQTETLRLQERLILKRAKDLGFDLSLQQVRIVLGVVLEKGNKEIEARLGFNPGTVGNKLTYLYIKTGTADRFELAMLFKYPSLQKDVAASPPAFFQQLSPRGRQITNLIIEGKGYKKIAAQLHIPAMTIKNHVKKLFGEVEACMGIRPHRRFELIEITIRAMQNERATEPTRPEIVRSDGIAPAASGMVSSPDVRHPARPKPPSPILPVGAVAVPLSAGPR